MKTRLITAAIALCALAMGMQAQECSVDMQVIGGSKGEFVPPEVARRLEAKLSNAMSRAGMTSADYDTPFFVAGRFDDAYNDVTSGPSSKTILKTTLTLMIGDANTQKIFDTETFEL